MRNKIKKTLAIIISLSFVFSLFTSISVNAEYSDLQESFSYKVDLLETLGIIEGYNDGTFRPDQSVSRVECMSFILRMMGIKDFASYKDGHIGDMKSSDWGYEAACTAADLGIIKLDENGNCNPNGYTTVEHAAIMIVRALGYEIAVKGNNYLAVAQNAGIFKDVYNTNGNLTRKQIVNMLYNAIHVRVMEQTGYGSNETFSTSNDNTILWLNQHIYRERGIVNGNYLTSVGDITTSMQEEDVMIDGNIFNVGNTDAAKYLGYEVEYYAQRDVQSGEDTLLYIIPTSKNKELKLVGEEAETIEADNVLYWSYYAKDTSKRKKIKLNENVTVLYNGIKDYNFKLETFVFDDGYIKLLDNDGNGDYDVVFVNCHESYTVSGIDTEYEVINGYGGYVLEYGKYDNIVVEDESGQNIKITDIHEGSTVSAFKSKGTDLLKIIVSKKTVEGAIESTTANDGDIKILLENEWYELADNIFTYDTGELKAGTEGIFYVTYEGKICFYRISSSKEFKYGFLFAAGLTDEVFDEGVGRLKVFTEDGVVSTYETTEYIRWNGNTRDPNSRNKYTFADVLLNLKDSVGSLEPQIIRFALNDEGKISKILTDAGTVHEYENNYLVSNKVLSSATYKTRSKSFDGNYFIDDNTVIFSVPEQDAYGNYNETEFRIMKTSDLFNDTVYNNISLYDLTDTNVCGAITMSFTAEKTVEAQNTFIVTSIGKGVNKDEDVVDMLNGYFKGEKTSFYVKDGLDVSTIEKDMVIWIVLNANGYVVNYGRIFDLENQVALDDAVSRINSESYIIGFYSYFLGDAFSKQNNYLSIKINDTYVLGNYIQSDVNVYYYEPDSRYSITPTSINNIQAMRTGGSRVFIRRCNGLAKDIIIIK